MTLPKKLGGAGGNFLSGEEIPAKGLIAKIIEEPHMVPSNFPTKDGKPKEQCRVLIQFGKGVQRLWTMNAMSFNKIVEEYGVNEKAWVGKKLRLESKSAFVSGQMRQIVYGEPA